MKLVACLYTYIHTCMHTCIHTPQHAYMYILPASFSNLRQQHLLQLFLFLVLTILCMHVTGLMIVSTNIQGEIRAHNSTVGRHLHLKEVHSSVHHTNISKPLAFELAKQNRDPTDVSVCCRSDYYMSFRKRLILNGKIIGLPILFSQLARKWLWQKLLSRELSCYVMSKS
jgi:hypothetical protein